MTSIFHDLDNRGNSWKIDISVKSFAFTFTTLFINDFRDLFETYFLLNVSGRIPLHSS